MPPKLIIIIVVAIAIVVAVVGIVIHIVASGIVVVMVAVGMIVWSGIETQQICQHFRFWEGGYVRSDIPGVSLD
jgi:type IV secretory pathway VirB3-like protein